MTQVLRGGPYGSSISLLALVTGVQDFLDNVYEEVVHTVRRLGSHPSIVLWSGNNANQVHNTHTLMHSHTRAHTHTHTFNMYTHAHAHAHAHTHTHTCTCTRTHTHVHAHTRTHTHTHVHAHARTHTHTHNTYTVTTCACTFTNSTVVCSSPLYDV